MIEIHVGSAENYQVRASEEEPDLIAKSTVNSLRRVARAAKRQAEKSRTSLWDKALGPFFSGKQVAAELNLTEHDVAQMTRDHEIVGLLTTDRVWVYPTFQFDGPQHQVDLAEVFRVLVTSELDDWTAAGWLVARHLELDGMSPVEWVWAGQDLNEVLWLAHDTAHRFAH